jgi:hypothetical protein
MLAPGAARLHADRGAGELDLGALRERHRDLVVAGLVGNCEHELSGELIAGRESDREERPHRLPGDGATAAVSPVDAESTRLDRLRVPEGRPGEVGDGEWNRSGRAALHRDELARRIARTERSEVVGRVLPAPERDHVEVRRAAHPGRVQGIVEKRAERVLRLRIEGTAVHDEHPEAERAERIDGGALGEPPAERGDVPLER